MMPSIIENTTFFMYAALHSYSSHLFFLNTIILFINMNCILIFKYCLNLAGFNVLVCSLRIKLPLFLIKATKVLQSRAGSNFEFVFYCLIINIKHRVAAGI